LFAGSRSFKLTNEISLTKSGCPISAGAVCSLKRSSIDG
jgi:hypothetical protein